MVKLFWRNQDEAKVRQIISEDANKVVALAYVSGWDADLYVVADSSDEYNEWVSETIPNPSAGWSTTEVAHIFK